jgi:hypothetical protein
VIEIVRVIEAQAGLYSYKVTQDEELAIQLESVLEMTKPKLFQPRWHKLIYTPFRYTPPHKNGRFRPPYGKNVFYGSKNEETTLYEHAFHFMKERIHLNITPATGLRTIFCVEADDKNSTSIVKERNFPAIMDKNDYSASHQFVTTNPNVSFIIYPSCRDPHKRDNVAILDINHLEKTPKWDSTTKFFYDNHKKIITWIDYKLHIDWNQVN